MRTEEGVFSGGASFKPREFHIPKHILALATMTRLRRILIPRCLRECTRLWRTQLYSCVSRFKIFGHIWTARRTCLVPHTWGRRASPWRSSDSWHVSVSLQVKSQGSVKTKAIPAIPRISNCFEAFRAQGRFEFDRLEDTRQVCCWPRAI